MKNIESHLETYIEMISQIIELLVDETIIDYDLRTLLIKSIEENYQKLNILKNK